MTDQTPDESDRPMPDWVTCPACHESGCVNLGDFEDCSGRPPYDHDRYGLVYRLHFDCGFCWKSFTVTFMHRHSEVLVETAAGAESLRLWQAGRQA